MMLKNSIGSQKSHRFKLLNKLLNKLEEARNNLHPSLKQPHPLNMVRQTRLLLNFITSNYYAPDHASQS